MTGPNSNASVKQYHTPTPQPPIGTPTVGPTPPLPHTGTMLPVFEIIGGLSLFACAVVLIVLIRPWFERRWARQDGR